MHHYKYLLPSQIVCLREGAKLIVVIPPIWKTAPELEHLAHKNTTKKLILCCRLHVTACWLRIERSSWNKLAGHIKSKERGGLVTSINFVWNSGQRDKTWHNEPTQNNIGSFLDSGCRSLVWCLWVHQEKICSILIAAFSVFWILWTYSWWRCAQQ